ncbi:hypothetical protein GF352_00545 [archaeon]|nr:hypothetical protein [archaeon]
MRRRGQFFIATVVLIALTLSVTTLNLNVPKELKISQLIITDESVSNALFVKRTLGELGNYFRQNWLMPYTHRTVISTENNFTLRDYTVEAVINLPDNAYPDALMLTDDSNNPVPFNVEWSNRGAREGIIYTQSTANSLDDNTYYLYYTVTGDGVEGFNQEQQVFYGESGNTIWVRTGNYYVEIDKNAGGSISLLENSETQDNLVLFDNIITCNSVDYPLSSAGNQEVTITDKEYYIKVVFTGTRFVNETYELTQLFFPDKILIIDEMRIVSPSECNWGSKLVVDKNYLMNYVDSEGNTWEPAPVRAEEFVTNGEWFELYRGAYGLGLAGDNASPIYASSDASENRAVKRMFSSETTMSGTYINNISLIPLIKIGLNQTRQYSKTTATTTNQVFTEELNALFELLDNYFYDVNAVVTHNEEIGVFDEGYRNITSWFSNYTTRNLFFTSGPNSLVPLETGLSLKQGFDPNSVAFYSKGLIPHQVSTDNYHNSSCFKSLNNSIVNHSLLLFNPDGQSFDVTITKQGANDLTTSIYYPNGSLINDFTFNTSPYSLGLINPSQAGFYQFDFNGSDTFSINSTLPKTIVRTPVGLSNNSPLKLVVDEGVDLIEINITTYSSNTQLFELYNSLGNKVYNLTHSAPGASQFNVSVTPCISSCAYELRISNPGPFMFNTSPINYVSFSDDYLINPESPEITLVSVSKPGTKYVYYDTNTSINKPVYTSDLVYSESDFEVNNSFISFDLDDLEFYYAGREWLGSRGWTSCTTSCVNSFSDLRFVEKGSERVVVEADTSVGVKYLFHFYPNTSYFKITTNASSSHSFGPGWRVNNTDDLYYSFKDSGSKLLGDANNYLFKHNLTGPRSYVTKSDESCSASIILDTNVLEANNSVKINDTSIIIKAYKPGTYGFLVNEGAADYLESVITNQYGLRVRYVYDSSTLVMNGDLFT